MLYIFFLTCILAALTLSFLIAPKIGLVDIPDARKKHMGDTPLIGGISLWTGLTLIYLFIPSITPHYNILWTCSSLLFFMGLIDDIINLPVLPRIIIQLIISYILIGINFTIYYIGTPFYSPLFIQGGMSYFLTFVITMSIINSFNMLDGMNGLLGFNSIVSLVSFGMIFYVKSFYSYAYLCILISFTIIPYLFLNLTSGKWMRFRIFMGDSGSTVIGFIITWMLINYTQSTEPKQNPMHCIWFISIPIIDMIAVSIRRVCISGNPFKADRGHIHHLLLNLGFTSSQTLIILTTISILCSLLGILFIVFNIPETTTFILFLSTILLWTCISYKIYNKTSVFS